MVKTNKILTGLRRLSIPFLCVAILAYLSYHSVHGKRGLSAWRDLTQQIKSVESDLSNAIDKRRSLEHRVSLLQSDRLDRDMLEERALEVLGLTQPNELVFLK